jgi:hypothetical protein
MYLALFLSSLLGLEQARRFATARDIVAATSQDLRDVFLMNMRMDFLREGILHGGVRLTGLGNEPMSVIHLRMRLRSGNVSEPVVIRPQFVTPRVELIRPVRLRQAPDTTGRPGLHQETPVDVERQ